MTVDIARKEWLDCYHDGRFRLAAVLTLALISAGYLFGWCNYQDLSSQAKEAAEHDYRRWGQQDPKNPHDAAHYGIYAFKTPRPLAIFDSGIQPYVGASVYNTAHIQYEVEYPPAQDTTELQRFGDMSPAVVLQVLLPLLVILLSYGAFAGEREQGTLRQLLSLGVQPKRLLWGKTLGISVALTALLLPVAVAGVVMVAYLAPPESRPDEMVRALWLIGINVLYLAIFLFLSLGVSACCRSSRPALALLLVIWGLTVFALPRVLLDVGGRLYPTPNATDFMDKRLGEVAATWDVSDKETRKRLLVQYHVGKIEDLPFDAEGILVQDSEEGSWPVLERYEQQLYGTYGKQNRLLEWGTLLSPSVGISLLSMALSGNDLLQHRDFCRQVEQHRRSSIKTLNDYLMTHTQKTKDGWDTANIKGDRALWQSIPAFAYRHPTWPAALSPYRLVIMLLALWGIVAFIFARLSVARLSGE